MPQSVRLLHLLLQPPRWGFLDPCYVNQFFPDYFLKLVFPGPSTALHDPYPTPSVLPSFFLVYFIFLLLSPSQMARSSSVFHAPTPHIITLLAVLFYPSISTHTLPSFNPYPPFPTHNVTLRTHPLLPYNDPNTVAGIRTFLHQTSPYIPSI